MPPLKQALALPDDVHLLERLNSGMSHLITDGDADVRREARKVGWRGWTISRGAAELQQAAVRWGRLLLSTGGQSGTPVSTCRLSTCLKYTLCCCMHAGACPPSLSSAVDALPLALPPGQRGLQVPARAHVVRRAGEQQRRGQGIRGGGCGAGRGGARLPLRSGAAGQVREGGLERSVYVLWAGWGARVHCQRPPLWDPSVLTTGTCCCRVHAEIAAYDEQLRPAHARLALSLPGQVRGDGRGGSKPLVKQKSGPAVPAPAATQLASHLRSSSDGPAEPRRDKGLAASLQSGRSASMDSAVDGRLQQHRGAEASSGGGGKGGSRARADASRSKVAARLRASAPGTPHIGGSTPHSQGAAGTGGEAAAAISAAAGAAGSVPQQQRRAAGWQPPAGSSPSRLSQQSPSAAAAGKAPPQPSRLSRPSPPSAAKRPPPGAPLLAPPTAQPAAASLALPAPAAAAPMGSALAAASAGGALSGGGALAGNGSGGLLQRPSLKGAATRAAAEVQQLALKLRSALLSGEPVAAAAAPAPAQPQAPQLAPGIRGSAAYGSSAPSRAAGSSGGGMKMSAEGRGGGGGGGLGFSVRGMTQLVGSGRAGPDTPGGR